MAGIGIGANGNIRIVVHQSKIVGMHLPGGDIHRYVDALTDRTVQFAKIGAPKRTWKLTNSIRKEIDMRGAAAGRLTGRVRADAKYAKYVHEGTTGPITPKNGLWLSVPAYPGATRTKAKKSVRGQRANPFLEDALRQAMATADVVGTRLR